MPVSLALTLPSLLTGAVEQSVGGATVARSQDDSLLGYGEIGGGTTMNRKS